MSTYIAPRTKAQLLKLVDTLEHDNKLLGIIRRSAEREVDDMKREIEKLKAALLTIQRIAEAP